jgi:hypothetical protein
MVRDKHLSGDGSADTARGDCLALRQAPLAVFSFHPPGDCLMRCIPGRAILLLVVVMAMGLFFGARGEEAEGKAPVPRPRVPPGKSLLRGKIILKGKAPDLGKLTKQLRTEIENKVDLKDYCLKCEDFEKTQQLYRLGGPENKQVGNVFVWIAPAIGSFFPIDDAQLEEARKRAIAIRQPHCAFIPHCAVLFSHYHPDPQNPRRLQATGQVFKIINDAAIAHNTNWRGGARNPGDNVIIPAKRERVVNNLVPDATPIVIKCNIHPWMDAYVRIFDHPYASVSRAEPEAKKEDGNFGTYEIKNVPAGKARIFAWHERAGWLNKGSGQGEPIELKDGALTVKDFELETLKKDQ